VLFVGLDGCDVRVLRRFAAGGSPPVLAGLLASAARAETEPPVGLFEGALRPTLFTGRSVARGGIYCHEALEVGTYRRADVSPAEISSNAGRRVAVVQEGPR
jgi:hypothetical protein